METEQKQKKILFAGLTLLVLAGIFLYSASLLDRNTPVIQSVETTALMPTETEPIVPEPRKYVGVTDEPVNVDPSKYKSVRVSDGKTKLTFSVPKVWLTETRHSGERKPTLAEMKDFLATNYDGDIRKNPELASDYADLPWEYLEKKMTAEDIEKAYLQTDNPWNLFPNATVSGSDHIWYTDTSWKQIDFYILRDFSTLETYTNAVYKSNDILVWGKQMVSGLEAEVVTFATEKDEYGNEGISKGGTGGKAYFISLNETDKLVVIKQAKGDEAFERDFRYLIQTLKVSP